MQQQNPLRLLEGYGQSIWLDFLSRNIISSGELKRLIVEDGLSGVTDNPTIFNKAVTGGHDYDASIRALAQAGKEPLAIYELLAIEDVQAAADLLRPTYDRLDGRDGFVSLEVSPYLAHDTAGTVAEARRLWLALNRPNVLIKVPGTKEGLPAIEQLIADGINVNITLLFGLPRYRQVADAYMAGLESLVARGKRLDRSASVASFFLSRIDVLIDPMLEAAVAGGDGKLAELMRAHAAIASAKVAYEIYREIVAGERFAALAAQGARPQRLLWASTSTKNPDYSDVMYVEALIGRDTINTLPQETIDSYRDHGKPESRLEQGIDTAHQVLASLPRLGIDIDAVTQKLEDEGIRKFVASFDDLLHVIDRARAESAIAPAAGKI